MDDLLDGDLAAAAETAAGLVPDFVSQMDRLVPEIAAGGDRGAVLRYYFAVESAAQTLTALPSDGPRERRWCRDRAPAPAPGRCRTGVGGAVG